MERRSHTHSLTDELRREVYIGMSWSLLPELANPKRPLEERVVLARFIGRLVERADKNRR